MDIDLKILLEFSYGRVEVLEPIGFDASNFIIEQDKDKFGRDVTYGNDKIKLNFSNEIGDKLQTPRVLNNGVILKHINSGLDLILNENKEFGSEAVVNLIIQKNDIDIIVGQLDFGKTSSTDGVTYFKCSIIQNTQQALIKRREDIDIDVFSDKDLDENTITPIETFKVLFKAKPINQVSEWGYTGNFRQILLLGSGTAFSPFQQVFNYGIDDTLSFLDTSVFNGLYARMSLIRAANTLSNTSVDINLNYFVNYSINQGLRLYVVAGLDTSNITFSQFFNLGQTEGNNYSYDLNVIIPALAISEKIWIYFRTDAGASSFFDITYSNPRVVISTTSTAISSVTDAVKYIDLIKQNYKGIGSSEVIAPKFETGGVFNKQACFNGKMIRQQLNEPFYVKLKDTIEQLMEVCADSQVNKDNNYIGQYSDYYPNIDLGGFLEAPDKDFSIEKNEKYLINKFTYGNKKYEQDDSESGTTDSVFTDSEWYVQNSQSSNEKKINNPYVRDVFMGERVRRLGVNNETTSFSSDDDTFIYDIIELAPNSRESFVIPLKFQKVSATNTFTILADKTFSWDLLGFNVGDTILVNGVGYVVNIITNTLLTLQYTGANDSGEEVLTIDYPLTNVGWTIRTNEGLTFSENIQNPDKYGNLRYSLKHNIEHWKPYLATAGKFIPNKNINNTFYKSNGEAVTKFLEDPYNIKENETITINSIAEKKILSQNIINTTITANFDKVKKLLEDMQTINPDKTIGGFIRVQTQAGATLKGYINKLDHLWKFEEMTLILEERNESDFLDIVYTGGILTINEVGYDTKTVTEKRFNIFNDYIRFFDENNVYLCNSTKYDFVKFNGVVYNSADELVIAIQSV